MATLQRLRQSFRSKNHPFKNRQKTKTKFTLHLEYEYLELNVSSKFTPSNLLILLQRGKIIIKSPAVNWEPSFKASNSGTCLWNPTFSLSLPISYSFRDTEPDVYLTLISLSSKGKEKMLAKAKFNIKEFFEPSIPKKILFKLRPLSQKVNYCSLYLSGVHHVETDVVDDSNEMCLSRTPIESPLFKKVTTSVSPKESLNSFCQSSESPLSFIQKESFSSFDEKKESSFLFDQTESSFSSDQTKSPFSSEKTKSPLPDLETKGSFPSVQTETILPDLESKGSFPSVQTKSSFPSVQTERSFPSVQTASPLPSSHLIKTSASSIKTEGILSSVQTESSLSSEQTESFSLTTESNPTPVISSCIPKEISKKNSKDLSSFSIFETNTFQPCNVVLLEKPSLEIQVSPSRQITNGVSKCVLSQEEEETLNWAKTVLSSSNRIKITNLSSSWRNGVALCCLIHSFYPSLIPLSQVENYNREKNLLLAISASQLLGVQGPEESIASSSSSALARYLSNLKRVLESKSHKNLSVDEMETWKRSLPSWFPSSSSPPVLSSQNIIENNNAFSFSPKALAFRQNEKSTSTHLFFQDSMAYYKRELTFLSQEEERLAQEKNELELRLRKDNICNDESLQKWISLVNEKNSVVRRQMQLNISEKESHLNGRMEKLKARLHEIDEIDEELKTEELRNEERDLMEKLVCTVNEKNELVHQLDSQEKGIEDDERISKSLQEQSHLSSGDSRETEDECVIQ